MFIDGGGQQATAATTTIKFERAEKCYLLLECGYGIEFSRVAGWESCWTPTTAAKCATTILYKRRNKWSKLRPLLCAVGKWSTAAATAIFFPATEFDNA